MPRRHRLTFFCLALTLCFAGGRLPGLAAEGSKGGWRTDFSAAQAEAERSKKPLLIHFSATWCQPCSKMDREVLKSADVRKLLEDRFVGVKVDADQRRDLIEQFGIQSLPSDVIIDPHNGRVLMESQGSVDLKRYVSSALRAEGKYQQTLKQYVVNEQQKLPKVEDEQPIRPRENQPGGVESLTIDLGTPQPLVGLDGFSPVSLVKSRKWVRGSAEFTWDHQGVTYQLASREELAEFRRDPGAYAPRLLGCDPVVLWESDRVLPGRTLYGAFYDDELYLFTSAENRKRFKANPRRFIKTQHVLKVDQIDRTALSEESHLKRS